MKRVIQAKHLWSGGQLHSDVALHIIDGVVTGQEAASRADVFLAMPACTDLQVNGGGGVMVNDATGADGLRAIAAAHRALGTGWILPTIITDTPDVLENAVNAALETAGTPGLLGLHIEGPHLAPSRRGTHAERHIRPLDHATVDMARALRAAGLHVIVTLAPELAPPDLLRGLLHTGAVVSAGHSAANAEQARAAFAAGVSCVTHLFNAMEPMTARAPGLLGVAITAPVFCGIIADGIHVAPEMLRLALAARPAPGLTFAVSDAMATVGGPDHFTLYGQEITLRDGRLVNGEGALAGAHLDLLTSLRNLHRFGLPLDLAISMVTDTPRRALGLPPQNISAGWAIEDLVFLDETLRPVRGIV